MELVVQKMDSDYENGLAYFYLVGYFLLFKILSDTLEMVWLASWEGPSTCHCSTVAGHTPYEVHDSTGLPTQGHR